MQLTRIPSTLATAILVFLVLSPVLSAQSTWNGSVSSVWSLAGNWTGGVPSSGTNAVIPSGTPNSPSTSGVATAACDSLTVNAGATLTIASGFNLAVSASATVNGTIAGTGSLRLVGGTAANLSGAGNIATNLEVAKTGTSVTLSSNVTAGSFTLTSGSFIASASSGQTLTVTGNALFQGGALGLINIGIIDVAGNVTFSGTSATGQLPSIRCAGNWSSDSSFAPRSEERRVGKERRAGRTMSAYRNIKELTSAAGSVASTAQN